MGRELTWIRWILHSKDFAETFVLLPPKVDVSMIP
jgi:hypothetical protein